MRRDGGVVLINALVIVLTISAVAAALLARSETARVRAADAQNANQLELYLDGIEQLMPRLLQDPSTEGSAHFGQAWASDGLRYPIDRGQVAAKIDDLQGRLNVNWLVRENAYVQDLFTRVFSEAGVPQALLTEITAYVGPSGPRGTAQYLTRNPPVRPPGGSLASIEELREIQGMTPEYMAVLRPILAALPSDSRLNLNTASRTLLEAALDPFPAEVTREIVTSDAPILAMSIIRNRVIEIREDENTDDLPFDYLSVGSKWFEAELVAELDGRYQRRRVVYFVEASTTNPVRRAYRWAVYD